MNDGLACLCSIPLSWREADLDEAARLAMMREATLLLTAINQMEAAHEMEGASQENRRLERIEAKLDLALHLLARALEAGAPPPSRPVKITPVGAEWDDPAPPRTGAALVLELRLSQALPLTVQLPAFAQAAPSGMVRADFSGLPPDLEDVLHQFVFRRHRQAIRAKTV